MKIKKCIALSIFFVGFALTGCGDDSSKKELDELKQANDAKIQALEKTVADAKAAAEKARVDAAAAAAKAEADKKAAAAKAAAAAQ